MVVMVLLLTLMWMRVRTLLHVCVVIDDLSAVRRGLGTGWLRSKVQFQAGSAELALKNRDLLEVCVANC
jgi:hypothetical protein